MRAVSRSTTSKGSAREATAVKGSISKIVTSKGSTSEATAAEGSISMSTTSRNSMRVATAFEVSVRKIATREGSKKEVSTIEGSTSKGNASVHADTGGCLAVALDREAMPADAGGGVAAAGGGTYCHPLTLRQDAEGGAVDRLGLHGRRYTPCIGARGDVCDHVGRLREGQPIIRTKSLNPTEPKEIRILCRKGRRGEREPQCSHSKRSQDAERSRVRLGLTWRDAQGCRRRRDANHSCGNDYGHDHEERKKRMAAAAVHCTCWCLALTLKCVCVCPRVGPNTQ